MPGADPGPGWVFRLIRRLARPSASHPAAGPAADEVSVLLARADGARDRRDWGAAASGYEAVLRHRADDAAIVIQYAHALKESGRWSEADHAYSRAAHLAPSDAEPWLHRAHLLKAMGRREEATEAFIEALTRDPQSPGARQEVIALGARGRLPRAAYGPERSVEDLAFLGRSLQDGLRRLDAFVQSSAFPVEAYDAFRRAYPLSPPPESARGSIKVLIDAQTASPADVALTLESLSDQSFTSWTGVICANLDVLSHPVASLAAVDGRARFTDRRTLWEALDAAAGESILSLPAGLRLAPYALDWWLWAQSRTGAGAVYADHDHYEEHWRLGPIFREPVLHGAPDRDDLSTTPTPPLAVLVDADTVTILRDVWESSLPGPLRAREVLLQALDRRDVVHLPRVLYSVGSASVSAEIATPLPSLPESDDRILMIIPTRDEAETLGAAVASLRSKAERPDLLDILVVDNRSVEEATARRLRALQESGAVTVLDHDEPFNWSRINNIGAEGRDQTLLVFANNDVEALSTGWDDIVRRALARPGVGVVGARLLYPDRTVQHAGIVFGAGEGRPCHEGVGASTTDAGPGARWLRRRPAAAVTGAFMAVRRSVFSQLAGFDERLTIGYSDIDFCLRARAAGLKVIYEPALELVHHESKSRGLNDSPDKVAYDDLELKRLYGIWGETLLTDPGVNPQWANHDGRPMDGFREPTLKQISAWLDQSCTKPPWAIHAPREVKPAPDRAH